MAISIEILTYELNLKKRELKNHKKTFELTKDIQSCRPDIEVVIISHLEEDVIDIEKSICILSRR